MIYKEKEEKMGDFWYSFCTDNLGKKYSNWIVPCRILGISPAEYAKLLIEEYGATVSYTTYLSVKWARQVDESRWRNYINKVAREKGFHI